MTDRDATKLLAMFRAAYPALYKDFDAKLGAHTWSTILADVPYELAEAAAMSYMRTEHFPPTPADVYARVQNLLPGEMTEAEAWALVRKAVSNGIYHATAEFNALPEMVQRIVGSPEQIRAWAMDETGTLDTVIASNFQRSYRAAMERNKDVQALPAAVREELSGMTERLALGGAA